MNYLIAYNTDTGNRKNINQDSLLIKRAVFRGEQIILAVICDGMGGLKKGELASATVVRGLSCWFEEELPKILLSDDVDNEIKSSWELFLEQVNQKIKDYGKQFSNGMGTTVTAILFLNEKYYIIHVGDCRVYELTNHIVQLTKDQTLAAREAEKGNLTEEQIENDSRGNVLLQCIGASMQITPEFKMGEVAKNAVYLLCSDGFRHKINSQGIYQYFNPDGMVEQVVMKDQCQKLTKLVMALGEHDNISVIVIRTFEGV